MVETTEAAEAHHDDTTGQLVNHQVIEFADLPVPQVADVDAFDIFTGVLIFTGVFGMGGHGRHDRPFRWQTPLVA